jgi:metallo-beta-lactamase family protein
MKITFHGAAREVTGSQHLLEINGHKLLLDCGLYQGGRQESYEINSRFHYEPCELGAVLLSHAHIDHSGNLPRLVNQGYEGSIYTTFVTAHLAEVMLKDSASIQEAESESINKGSKSSGDDSEEKTSIRPLYTTADAEQAIQQMKGTPYQHTFEPIPGVQARFVEAGHILGSASIVLDIEEKGRKLRLWFSGDVGRPLLPLVRDPVLPEKADTLLMESTYGDMNHPSPEKAYAELRQALLKTFERNGKVIIPAFAVGRTQELVYKLNEMIEAGELPKVPVFVDSPLAINVSDIFSEHPQYFDEEAREFMGNGNDPLGFKLLTYTSSVEESKAIDNLDGPVVIIASSGMAEGGRILHHLAHNIRDSRNTILIVSYQAPNTLGRQLAEGASQVKIFGDNFQRQADVVNIRGFSAHAGQDDLVEYAKASKDTLKEVYLVHGEEQAAESLRSKLKQAGLKKVVYPYLRQTIEI